MCEGGPSDEEVPLCLSGWAGALGIEISHFLSLCPYICLEYIGNRRTRRDLGINGTNNRRNISVEVLE